MGLLLDERLTLKKKHGEHVSTKTEKFVGIMNKIKYYFPTKAMKSIHNCYIVPYSNYGNEVWFSAYRIPTVCYAKKKAIRIIKCCLPFNEHFFWIF